MTASKAKTFYVYALYDPDTNLPFYVGKGSGRRVKQHFWDYKNAFHNPYKRAVMDQIKARGKIAYSEILVDDIEDEQESYNIETVYITKWGLRGEGGLLTNLKPTHVMTNPYTHGGYKDDMYFNSDAHRTEVSARMNRLYAEGKHPAQLDHNRIATRKRNKDKVEAGTHQFLGPNHPGAISSRERAANGTHHLQSEKHAEYMRNKNRKQVASGTHAFQSKECRDAVNAVNLSRIADGTHHFLGPNGAGAISSRQRVADGTHHFLHMNRDDAIRANIERNGYRVQAVHQDTKEVTVFESLQDALKKVPSTTRNMIEGASRRNLPYMNYRWRVLGSRVKPVSEPWTVEEIAAMVKDPNVYNRLGTITKPTKKKA